jgi:hypothetical protein
MNIITTLPKYVINLCILCYNQLIIQFYQFIIINQVQVNSDDSVNKLYLSLQFSIHNTYSETQNVIWSKSLQNLKQ